MPRNAIPFVGPAYEARSLTLNAQRCVNLYPELDESPKGKSVAALYGTPGLITRQTFPGRGGVRGMHRTSKGGRPFVVQGDMLYELTSLSTREERGMIGGHSTLVSMDDNGLQLMIVADQRGWIYDLDADTLTEITDLDFPPATTVIYLDGYFIVNRATTAQFAWSALLDGLSWSGLDFASAESSPDKIVTVHRDHRELWLYGESTTEVWFNAGGQTQPFQRMQNAYLEYGVVTPWVVVSMDRRQYFVSLNAQGEGVVMQTTGYTPQRISTHAIEYAINQTDLGALSAYGYQEEGHWFYVLHTSDHTWAYDATTALWHERAGLGDDGRTLSHPAWVHMVALGTHLVGDRTQGILYESSLETYTNAGEPLPRIRSAPYVTALREEIFHERIELDLEVAVGQSTGDITEVDPRLMLAWSDTHGATWSNEHQLRMGKQGEQYTRAYKNRLGQARDRIYRVTITDPIKVSLLGAFLESHT